MKNKEAVPGLDYLEARGDVDKNALFLVGVCQGGPQCLDAASRDNPVKGVAAVTGYYRAKETNIYMICAGCVNTEPGVDARLERAKKAEDLYEKTGEVEYQPLVDPKAADPDVGALAGPTGPVVWAWYGPWTVSRSFENRHAVMSDLDHFGYTTVPGVAKRQTPALVVHGDNCMNAPAAKRHFDSIPTQKKKLIWDNNVSHFQQ